MNTNQLPTALPAAADEPVADPTGQLLLLPTETVLAESEAHARFRLSKRTRELGLRHVAEIRAQLAASKAARDDAGRTTRGAPGARDNVLDLRPDHRPAA